MHGRWWSSAKLNGAPTLGAVTEPSWAYPSAQSQGSLSLLLLATRMILSDIMHVLLIEKYELVPLHL